MPVPAAAGVIAVIYAVAKVFMAYRLVRILTVVATRLLIFAVIVAFFYAVIVAIEAVTANLSVVVPDVISQGFSMFLPDNFVSCVSAIITVQVIILVWHWKRYSIDFVSRGVQ